MKKCLFFFFIPHLIFAQAKPTEHQTEAATVSMHASNKSVLIIDPKARAKDLVQAYHLLRKDRPTLKITVASESGVFHNVVDLASSDGGTLIIIKTSSNQGVKMQIIPVEQIMEIGYLP